MWIRYFLSQHSFRLVVSVAHGVCVPFRVNIYTISLINSVCKRNFRYSIVSSAHTHSFRKYWMKVGDWMRDRDSEWKNEYEAMQSNEWKHTIRNSYKNFIFAVVVPIVFTSYYPYFSSFISRDILASSLLKVFQSEAMKRNDSIKQSNVNAVFFLT